ncbi:cytochrome P450 [Pisolithus marmoratus]|nr:cytochrome P450 [Pisolithus marmoratus]
MPFKVPTFNRWIVFIGRNHLQDIKRFKDDELSAIETAKDFLKTDHLLGPDIGANPYHISVVRIHLTRNFGRYYSDIKDEVHTAFEELLDLKDNGIVAAETMRRIVCRTSNRVYVGLPLCRDPDWIELNSRFAIDWITDANILKIFVSKILPNTAGSIKRAMKQLEPVIKGRLRCMREYEDEWSDKPDDILQWLIDEKQESSTRLFALRVLTINFASIYTFTQALYNLAAYPQYVEPLREEVDAIIQEHGWTAEAIAFDAEETQRHQGILLVTVQRKAMKDLTLSDGTFIPKGTYLFVPTYAVHRDSAVYENPDVFDPFRFTRHHTDRDEDTSHQMLGMNQDYLPFGYGKHVCPGRFLVAYEMKTMLAHILTSYDVKFEDGVPRPNNIHWDMTVIANPTARVMFRKRANN